MPGEFETLWGKRFEDFEQGLKKAVQERADRNAQRDARSKQIKQLRAQELTLREIGELFGITRERVRQLLAYEAPDAYVRRGPHSKIQTKDLRFYQLWRGILKGFINVANGPDNSEKERCGGCNGTGKVVAQN